MTDADPPAAVGAEFGEPAGTDGAAGVTMPHATAVTPRAINSRRAGNGGRTWDQKPGTL
jgi:hypothetical protein